MPVMEKLAKKKAPAEGSLGEKLVALLKQHPELLKKIEESEAASASGMEDGAPSEEDSEQPMLEIEIGKKKKPEMASKRAYME